MIKKIKRTSKSRKSKIEIENEILNDIHFNSTTTPNFNAKKKYQDLTYDLNIKFKNKKQKDLYTTILENRITFVKGSAGTGKTFIALLAALFALKTQEYNMKKIIFTKPYVQVVNNGSSTGFLKGTMEEKLQPYFVSFYSNLNKIVGNAWCTILKENNLIEDKLINFMRGETFGENDMHGNPIGSIAILDEAQNTSMGEMKTYISRMGENTKLIILGDSDQVDIKLGRNEKNGLDDAFDRFQDIPGISFIEFDEDDIVRDKFLIEVMKRYKL
jgi:phosphate starvation-inducible PhoH-like protein